MVDKWLHALNVKLGDQVTARRQLSRIAGRPLGLVELAEMGITHRQGPTRERRPDVVPSLFDVFVAGGSRVAARSKAE